MIRVIDDEDVAERIHIWIRKQNFNTTPTTFKKFVENELFPAIRIAREKSITIMTATRSDIEKHPYIPEKARYFLKPGINQEGYWTAEHLLEQIECKAISIFEALYPDCIAVFAFDNSSNHAAFSKDALVAS
ncbi:hypothetical protein RirG_029770 [Rhizophagus irregularis DAOM 197198w]|uniref:Uncharacterized protein n=1 Tax=Rhizophagus irregularis (strain DAOM 197198w) TaxID=1432141 RepID=A0A015K4V7_RHIIW|nr:hypothetical protein RirG_029770 [Rhizophagus irregularis DAOM 197198w]